MENGKLRKSRGGRRGRRIKAFGDKMIKGEVEIMLGGGKNVVSLHKFINT